MAFCFLMTIGTTLSGAALHYIRQGANGANNGTDWTNAYTDLPAVLIRGDTYYLAMGNYSSPTFNDLENGSQYITIKKAVAADHGTDVGWNDAYGAGKASFPGIYFSTGYWVFDGVTGTNRNGYGFEVYSTEAATTSADLVVLEGSISNISIKHTEIRRPSRNYYAAGIYGVSSPSNLTISDCYIHDLWGPNIYIIGSNNVLMERCYLERNNSSEAWHSEGIQARGVTNMIIRYCWFEDILGTGFIVSGSGHSRNWEIYGNVFNGGSGGGPVLDNFNDSISGVRFYNNTVYNATGNGGIHFYNSAGNNRVYNNLWYNIEWMSFDGVDEDYNYFSNAHFPCAVTTLASHDSPLVPEIIGGNCGNRSVDSADPFRDVSRGDYHLQTPFSGYPGLALPSPYNVDYEGSLRGSDGVWDRGAFEYGGSTHTTLPSSPKNLRIR